MTARTPSGAFWPPFAAYVARVQATENRLPTQAEVRAACSHAVGRRMPVGTLRDYTRRLRAQQGIQLPSQSPRHRKPRTLEAAARWVAQQTRDLGRSPLMTEFAAAFPRIYTRDRKRLRDLLEQDYNLFLLDALPGAPPADEPEASEPPPVRGDTWGEQASIARQPRAAADCPLGIRLAVITGQQVTVYKVDGEVSRFTSVRANWWAARLDAAGVCVYAR